MTHDEAGRLYTTLGDRTQFWSRLGRGRSGMTLREGTLTVILEESPDGVFHHVLTECGIGYVYVHRLMRVRDDTQLSTR